jgi:hypothetical protein
MTHTRSVVYTAFIVIVALCGVARVAAADTITISGTISQAQDESVPATNNPALNDIAIGDAYTVTLTFAGSITAPGTYNLSGGSLTFTDAAAGATETSFGLISLTIAPTGLSNDLSLLGCLTTGSGCFVGNQLTANFRIPAASLHLQNVAAFGLDEPHPLDLLEDDATTDIHGSIVTYSYVPASAVPEPSSMLMLGSAVAMALAAKRSRRTVSSKETNT